MEPWNDWYHVSGNTYGTWRPGDPRGHATRHGRSQRPVKDHFEKSKRLMVREPVRLSVEARRVALSAFVGALEFHDIDVVICAVDDHHFHLLARFGDRRPRRWVGIAKKESARAVSREGLAEAGGVWAVRCRCGPIRDRAHQVAVAGYIEAHAEAGAVVWRLGRVIEVGRPGDGAEWIRTRSLE